MMTLCPSTASACAVVVSPAERLEVLFEELAELTGQRNAIDGRIVEIVAEIDRDELCGRHRRAVGAGVGGLEDRAASPANAHTIATIAGRLPEFPRCAAGPAGGSVVAGSGRRHRGAGRRGI